MCHPFLLVLFNSSLIAVILPATLHNVSWLQLSLMHYISLRPLPFAVSWCLTKHIYVPQTPDNLIFLTRFFDIILFAFISMNIAYTTSISGLLLDRALAYTIVDCLVVALALYLAATSNSGRASTYLHGHFIIKSIPEVLVLVAAAQNCVDVANYFAPLAAAVLPVLAQQRSGYIIFQLACFINVHRGLFSNHIMHWMGSLLHIILFLTRLDPQSQSVLRALMDNILFMQERQLIRLGKLRDLVFEDVWQLPDRLRLDVVHGELKYNIDEPLFLMRAIIRMIWRPLLPLYAILSLLRILDVVEIVIGSYVLHCLDTPSDHEWYHGYGAAICLLIVKLSKRQRYRVEDYAEMEITRAIRALELVIFHQPLDSKKGRILQTRGDCRYEVWMLLHNLQYVLSIGTNVLALVAAFWPVFYKVGWLVIIPPLISIGTMLATWGLEWLTGNRYEWEVDRAARLNNSSVGEIYRGIKSIKLFGWERMYLDPTLLKYYSHTKEIPWYAPVIRAIWTTIDIVEMLASQLSSYLIVHIYTQNSSFALVTFTNSDLFQLGSHISNGRSNLESVCSQLRALRSAVDKNFSIERYLKGRPCNTLSRLEITSILPGPTITMSACTFTWHKKAPNPVLEDISLNILPSELVAVVGKTGSGKSSLLLAICGELEMIKGSGSVTGTIAYLEQSPWIMNDTLRANITFGRDYDSRYFDKVIYACALAEDIAQWPNGDLTVIGERGVNISGGQKARLALARTLYSQADIYILDDPLSAVDAHVKRHILDHVILDTGLLAGKLRIVSTHSNHILPFAHQVVSLDSRTTTVTLQIPRTYCQIVSPPLSPSESTASGGSKSSLSVNVSKDRLPVQSANKLPIKQLKPTDPELRKLGDSYWDNTKYALQICGLPVLVVVLLSSLVKPLTVFVMDGLELNVLRESGIGGRFNREAALSHLRLLMVRDTLTKLIDYAEAFIRAFIASEYLESNVERLFVEHLIHAPTSFFDSNTRQYVTNAHRVGLYVLSSEIPRFLMKELANLVRVVSSVYHVGCSIPQLLLLVPLIAWATQRRDALIDPTMGALKKIAKTQRIAHSRVADIIADGKRMIRLFGVEAHFTKLYINDCDEKYRLTQPIIAFSQLSQAAYNAVSLAGDMIITFAMLLQTRYMRFKVSSGECITYQRLLNSLVKDTSKVVHLSSSMQAFSDNIDIYRWFTNIKPEAPYIVNSNRPASDWPQYGRIEFRNFNMRYCEDLPPVLVDINLTINPGEKIGIVGRTGAGKSTLAKALFRLTNAGTSGSILVDGLDIGSIGVGDLRPRLGIIPQESTMFSGSYKKNLDPLCEFTAEDIWAALLRCGVESNVSPPRVHKTETDDNYQFWLDRYEEDKAEAEERWANAGPMARLFLMAFTTWPRKPRREKLRKQKYGLDKYAAGGFSDGQQQLFSLCRLLLRKRRIIVLDEATADVDLATDKEMHRLISKEFSECTVLTIAHRLETVMNSDRIVVMDKGRIVEVGPPQELLKKDGHFAALVRTSNFGD